MKTKYKRLYGEGFTLLEVLFAAALIGLAIAALVATSSAFTMKNGIGVDLSTGEFLIEEIRELTAVLPVIDPESGTTTFGAEAGESAVSAYDDVDDFDGRSFNPPVDLSGASLPDFAAFTQQVTVENVSASNLDAVVANHTSDFVRVTVTVMKNNRPVNSASWIRARLN